MESKRRFLRDHVLDQMLNELRDIQQRVESRQEEFTSDVGPIFQAALELYEANKIVLGHIETVIESVRGSKSQELCLGDLTMAAAHLSMGITAFHSVLLQSSVIPHRNDEEQIEKTDPPPEPVS